MLWMPNAEKNQRAAAELGDRRAILEHGQSFASFGFFQSNGAPVTMTGMRRKPAACCRCRSTSTGCRWWACGRCSAAPTAGRLRRRGQAEGSACDRHQPRPGSGASAAHPTSSGGRSTWMASRGRSSASCRGDFTLVPWEDKIAFWAANDLRKIPEALDDRGRAAQAGCVD